MLSSNPVPGVIELLGQNPTEIDGYELSANPAIFQSYKIKNGVHKPTTDYKWGDQTADTWL